MCPEGERHLKLLEKYLKNKDIKISYINYFGKWTASWASKLLWYRINGYQILNIHWVPFDNYHKMKTARALCKLFQMRMVLTVHNIIPHDVKFGNLDSDLKGMKYLMDWSSSIIVHCERTKADIVERYNVSNEKIIVSLLGNYLDTVIPIKDQNHSRKQLGLPEDKILIFMMAPCREDKGLETFLSVIVALPEYYVGVLSGPCKDRKMMELIDKKCTDHPHKFIANLKHISDEELAMYYSAIDVVLIPYKKNTTSGGIMEAITYGKAVIAPPMGNISLLIEEGYNGYLASSFDEIIRALTRIDRSSATTMGENSLQVAKQYEWDDSANAYIEAFNKTME